MKSCRWLSLAFVVTCAHGQSADEPITVLTEAPSSAVQQVYFETLTTALLESGFDIRNETGPIPVSRGDLRKIVMESEATLGLSILQDHVGEGDTAAALLSAPGSFSSLSEQRVAQRGVIGDMARDEIAQKEIFALRLWSHSTNALISKATLASIDDFSGAKIITGDPYSVTFVTALEAAPVSLAFAETFTALQTGIAEAVVFPQEGLNDSTLSELEGGTVVPEYKMNVGATFASRQWWTSLTAPTQRALLDALDQANLAAGDALQDQIDQTRERSEERGVQFVSWEAFDAEEVRRAVGDAVVDGVGGNAEPILQLRDDMFEFDGASLRQNSSSGRAPATDVGRAEPLQSNARVFFASDRRLDDPNTGLLSDRFANALEIPAVVRCGELVPSREGVIGEVIEPPALVGGTKLHERSADCTALVAAALSESGGHLVVYIHGYRNDFDLAMRTSLAFARDSEIEGVVLGWTWPSAASLGSYGYDADSVAWSQPNFFKFIAQLLDEEALKRIDFIGHSMGTRLLAFLMRDEWIDRPSAVVLAAADVSRPILEQAVASAPTADVTVLATERDRALFVSNGIHKAPRVGRANPLFLHENVDTIDLSAFDQFLSLNHRHAFETPEVLADLKALFDGAWSAEERGLLVEPGRDDPPIDHFVILLDERSVVGVLPNDR